MRPDYLVLLLLWVMYCAVHSALISTSATSFFRQALGKRYCFYRIFYNLFSLITLIALVRYSNSPRFQSPALFVWSGNWKIAQYALILTGVALLLAGARQYSMRDFLGWNQIRNRRIPSPSEGPAEFNTRGILGFMRHPWYLAVFILIWASDLNLATVIINVVLSAYLVIGTLLEERKLVLEFGDKYREYQDRVSMFIPLKRLNPKRR